MKTCYVFFANGFEEIEALTVVDLLRRAQIPVQMVSISGDSQVTGSHGIEITADVSLNQVDLETAEMLILPGGQPGTENLYNCDELRAMITRFNDENRPLAAICAAPTVFGRMGLLKNRTATCYPGCEGNLNAGTYVTESVVVDGNITTSRGMGTAIPFGLKLVSILVSDEKAQALKEAIIY